MDAISEKHPLIRQGWLRVLLFCITYLLLIMLVSILVSVNILWIGNYPNPQAPAEMGKQFINGEFLGLTMLIVLVLSLLSVFIFRKFVDHKSFTSLGFPITGHFHEASAGFFLAPALLGIGTLVLFFSKHLQWADISFNGPDLFIEFGMMVMIAISEELVFRGYILNNLMDSFNKWTALIISAIIFALYHIDNPAINAIALVNILLAGILLGINYIYTKNLWFAILFHLGWNFFQGPLIGFRVSGLHLNTLLQTQLTGDISLTGGDFGFEGSIFDGAITAIAILLLYLIFEKKYRSKVHAV